MQRLIRLGKKLFPICRSITGNGTLETLKEIKKHCKDLKIKKIPSGKKVFDWKVPYEWNINNAFILDKNNNKIIDFKINNLHIINYSSPQKKKSQKKNYLKNFIL